MKPPIFKYIVDESKFNFTDPKDLDLRDIFMNLAFMLSFKATCRRGKAGCVVVKDKRIISVGYNGVPPNQKECIQRDACRQKGSKIPFSLNVWQQREDVEVDTEGCFDSLHAETNAFGFCLRNGINTDGCIVYLTGMPCKSCAQLMVACGTKRIYFSDEWRNKDGLLYLKEYGVEVIQLNRR